MSPAPALARSPVRGVAALVALLPTVAAACGWCGLPEVGWRQMLALGIGMYASAKALSLLAARRQPTAAATLAFLGLWAGMDVRPFAGPRTAAAPPARAWIAALVKIALGVLLAWWAVRRIAPASPLVAGWVGITAWILLLHCGAFHLMALAWRRAGVPVVDIMDAPLLAASLGEFWGRRWNMAFHDLVRAWCYAPLAPRIGAGGASLATFLLSGLIHDLIVSWPARGGYGLPTLYFLIQAAGVACERRLPRPWRRPLALVLVAAPAPLLFHPRFVDRVILPFLAATGALP